MMSRRVFWSLLPGIIAGWAIGCGTSEPTAPPVMNAIDQQQALEDAAEIARTRARAAEAAKNTRPMPSMAVPGSGKFEVEFDTSVGSFTIEVDREWAPVGANRFYYLVKDGFFNNSGFFRVVPGFMVQFGLAADPAVNSKWDNEIKDDPVVKSNTRGYVTFAKTGAPHSRTTQLFINYADNSRLDADQFSPFGFVTKGMDVVDKISSAHGEEPDQGRIKLQGNAYLSETFPQLDFIKTATMVVDDLE